MTDKEKTPYDPFFVNYYKWSLDDVEQEILKGFPLIGCVRGSGVEAFLDYLRPLPVNEQIRFSKLLIANGYPATAERCGDLVNEVEKAEIESFRRIFLDHTMRIAGEHWDLVGSGQRSKPDKRKLKKLIKGSLADICGEPDKTHLNDWFHQKRIDDWTLLTSVSLHGVDQVRYTHSLIHDRFNQTNLIDAMRWRAVSQITWNLIEAGEEDVACQQLTDLCAHFIDALPQMLA